MQMQEDRACKQFEILWNHAVTSKKNYMPYMQLKTVYKTFMKEMVQISYIKRKDHLKIVQFDVFETHVLA